MADSNDLATALSGLNIPWTDTTYGRLSSGIMQAAPAAINPYGSTGQAIGIALGGLLLGELGRYQGQKTAAEESLQALEGGTKVLGMQTPEERLGYIKGVEDTRVRDRLSKLALALQGQEKANALDIQQQVGRKIGELKGVAGFYQTPEGKAEQERQLAQLKAEAEAKSSPTFAKMIYQEGKKDERLAAITAARKDLLATQNQLTEARKKNLLTPKETEDLTDQTNFAAKAKELKNELSDLSYPEIQALIRAGKSPEYNPGLYSKFLQVQQIYRKPNFGAMLTGNELNVGEGVFGKNLLGTKEDMLAAIDFLGSSALDRSENYLVNKSKTAPELLGSVRKLKGASEVPAEQYAPSTSEPAMSDAERKNMELKAEIAKIEEMLAAKGK